MTYLGDGVSVEEDSLGYIVLTTSNGIRTTNTIVLDPVVWGRLLAFIEAMKARAQQPPVSP